MIEEHIDSSQALAAYEVISERARYDAGLAGMWLPQIEERWSRGEKLEELIHLALKSAYAWYPKASGALWPTDDGARTCLALFDVLGVEPPAPAYTSVAGHGKAAT